MTTRLTATGDYELGINGSAIWQRETGTTGGLWHSINEEIESVNLSTYIDLYSFGDNGPFPPADHDSSDANMFKCYIGPLADFPGNAVARIYVGSSTGTTEFYFGNIRVSYYRESGGNPLNLVEQDPSYSVNPYIQITNPSPHILEVPLLLTSPWPYKPDVIDKNLFLMFETARYSDGTGLASNARIYAVDVTFGELVYRYTFGGAVVGGNSNPSYISNIIGAGGARVGGQAFVPSYYFNVGSSGVVVGGIARVPTKFDEVGVGGVVLAGRFLTGRLLQESGISGCVVGGVRLDSYISRISSLGGAVLGGTAKVENLLYHFTSQGSVIVEGKSDYVYEHKYESSGEVIVGGTHDNRAFFSYSSTGLSEDAPPEYSGVTVGYQNSLNPTVVKLKYNLNIGVYWNTNAYLSKDYSFQWNTGRIRQYWYRIVGKGKEDICPPVQVTNCCMKYIMNIHARSIDDLCKKLTKLQWQWPIQSVQKFSRPAETIDINTDAANGITYDCNIAEEIEVCNNQLCAEFCIDFDLVEYWGGYSIAVRNRDIVTETSGGVIVDGSSDTSFTVIGNDFFVISDGGLNVSGESFIISSVYRFASDGGLELAGISAIESTNWNFLGGQWPLRTKLVGGKGYSQFTTDDHSQSWSVIERVITSNNSYAVTNLSYGRISYYLVVNDFGINVPEGSEILGIHVQIERTATSSVKDKEICLVIGEEIVSDNFAKNINWPIGIDGTISYGSMFIDWKSDDWDLDQINDPNFGVAIRVQPVTIGAGVTARVDVVRLQVYYQDPVHQYLRIEGSAKVKSSHYKYVGSGAVQLQNTLLNFSINRKFISVGRGSVGPNFSSINVSGQYAKGYHYNADGGISVDGAAIRKISDWNTVATGGIDLAGESRIKSPVYIWSSSGGIDLNSNNKTITRYKYSSNTGITISGESLSISNLHVIPQGEVIIAGEAIVRSTSQSWISQGSVVIGGDAISRYSDRGTQETFTGAYAIVQDLLMVFDTTQTRDSTLIIPETTVNACGCKAISLSLQFVHNTFTNNKLQQFLLRNNIIIPRINLLNYNKTNNSWQSNFRWIGKSTNTGQSELWTVVLDLLCTNLIGEDLIGVNIWKFTMSIVQKNLITLDDFDTKIVVAFLPDQICASSNFKFDINLDTSIGFTNINPSSSVYQSILYDNIGLFKTEYWLNNPNLQFTISQVGINNPIPRYQLLL